MNVTMRPIFRVVFLHKRGLFWLIEILFSIIKCNIISENMLYFYKPNGVTYFRIFTD
jgi:hypothetical protein